MSKPRRQERKAEILTSKRASKQNYLERWRKAFWKLRICGTPSSYGLSDVGFSIAADREKADGGVPGFSLCVRAVLDHHIDWKG